MQLTESDSIMVHLPNGSIFSGHVARIDGDTIHVQDKPFNHQCNGVTIHRADYSIRRATPWDSYYVARPIPATVKTSRNS